MIWLVKNLWLYNTGKPIEKGTQTTSIHKTGHWSANNDFTKAKKQSNLLSQPLLILKSVGFHILLLSVQCKMGLTGLHDPQRVFKIPFL